MFQILNLGLIFSCNLDEDETTCLKELLRMSQTKIMVKWGPVETENITLRGNWFVQLDDHLVDTKDRDYK
jgi:hypothetical protein